jgi:hypothetical protein
MLWGLKYLLNKTASSRDRQIPAALYRTPYRFRGSKVSQGEFTMKWFQTQSRSQNTDPIPQAFAGNDFDEVHTPSNPYCSDPHCSKCHYNSTYHDKVQHPERRTNTSDAAVAHSFFTDPGGESLYVSGVEEYFDEKGEKQQRFSYGLRQTTRGGY